MSRPAAVPLIPREVLFGNPDRATVRLSPDGAHLTFLAPVEGVLNVWVGPADDPGAARPVTQDTSHGIYRYRWAYTHEHVLYLQDKRGDENWRVYSVDLGTGGILDLTPFESVHARIQGRSPRFPDEILIALNVREVQLHDLCRAQITSGEMELVQENPEFSSFVTDSDFAVRFPLRMTPDGVSEILRPSEDGAWELLRSIAMEDMLTTQPVGIDSAGQTLYMIDSRGRNTAALVEVDSESGAQSVLAEDARSDAQGVIVHPGTQRVQAVAFSYERKHWKVLDPAIADDLTYLGTVADGEVEVASRTLDDRTWIVAYEMDDGPVRYYR